MPRFVIDTWSKKFTDINMAFWFYYYNEEQIISGCPIDGAISVRVDKPVWELSVVCLHNNAIVARY